MARLTTYENIELALRGYEFSRSGAVVQLANHTSVAILLVLMKSLFIPGKGCWIGCKMLSCRA
jgi:hypothetical protein